MPTYCYKCPLCGWTTDLALHRPKPPRSTICEVCAHDCKRDIQAEWSGKRLAQVGDIRSVAAGCIPGQANEMNKQAAQLGLSDKVQFDNRTGEAVFANRAAKLRVLREMGIHDEQEIKGGRSR